MQLRMESILPAKGDKATIDFKRMAGGLLVAEWSNAPVLKADVGVHQMQAWVVNVGGKRGWYEDSTPDFSVIYQ